MSEKPSTKYEEYLRSVELEILIGHEHAPAKRKKPEMLEKPSANNEFLRSVELEILMGGSMHMHKGITPRCRRSHRQLMSS